MTRDRLAEIARSAIGAAVEAEYPTTAVECARLADVAPRTVTWLWQDRIARGRLCLLAGDPGVGKSFLTCALAAAVSRGWALPGDVAREAADVLILSAEDSPEDTIRPRCEAVGADLARIRVVTAVRRDGKEGFFSLAEDLEALERELEDVALLIVDPIDGYVGHSTDTHRAAAIRSLLGPLTAMAERTGAAIVAVQHLTKGGRDRAIYRPQGSIGYVAAARTALLVAADPDDPTGSVRHVAGLKSNLGPLPAGLAFTLAGGRFCWVPDAGGKTADQLLADAGGGEDGGALAEAREWLVDLLAGSPVPAREVQRQAREAGIADHTLRRAKGAVGVRVRRSGFGRGGGWSWGLPGSIDAQAPAPVEISAPIGAPNARTVGTYDEDGHLCEPAPDPDGELDLLPLTALVSGPELPQVASEPVPGRPELVRLDPIPAVVQRAQAVFPGARYVGTRRQRPDPEPDRSDGVEQPGTGLADDGLWASLGAEAGLRA